MTKLKITHKIFVLIVCLVCLTSFKKEPKPHLIVGCWEITEKNSITLATPDTYIEQLYFGSDELSSAFIFTDKEGKFIKGNLNLAYNTYKNINGYKMPVVYFINTCDEDFKLAFTIEKLTKYSLELKCIRDLTSKDILLNREILKFEKIAGPNL